MCSDKDQFFPRTGEGVNQMFFHGVVRAGLGTGKKYVGITHFFDQFREFLGNAPFLGTLNIELDPAMLTMYEKAFIPLKPRTIPAMSVMGQAFWRVDAFWIDLWKEGNQFPRERCLALRFEHPVHHRTTIEVVSAVNLRVAKQVSFS